VTDARQPSVRQFLAVSDHWVARRARTFRQRWYTVSLPVPRPVAKIVLEVFLLVRGVYYWLRRVFVAEVLFKAYCRSYGRRLRTDIFIHWVQGRGDLVIGDDVLIDGKCSFTFAARYARRPTLIVGSGSGIGHECAFTIGKSITIGRKCRIAAGVWMFDSHGHPADPHTRLQDHAAPDSEVKPISIGDNVWIGGRAVIFPGVTIGEGSVVSACAVVTTDVPAYSIVAGNPARRIGTLSQPQPNIE
jgi:acetyltransferase-like isoleucine patch superfamily enzyme